MPTHRHTLRSAFGSRSHGRRVALALVLCFVGASAARAAGESDATPIATAAHVDVVLDTSRLVFELSAPVEAEAFVMADPRRIIVDLPEVNFQVDPKAGGAPARQGLRGKGQQPGLSKLISSFRFGLFAPGKSRIVIDLAKPARILRTATEGQDGKYRFQIELAETDEASFKNAARAAQKAATALAAGETVQPPAAQQGDTRPVIVIDPGHGGIDSGAQGRASVMEKDLVFEFSRTLKSQLESAGHYRVILTRSSDVFVALGDRVKLARNANAALFISIHADTLSSGAGVSGATVYTVSDRASDREAAKLAEKENDADAAAGLDGTENVNDVSDILFDLTRRETRAYSNVFARSLVAYWDGAGRLNKNPHRSAGFLVLKAPDVPSVLLELGYLSSEKDMAALMKPQWREQAVAAMVKAVDQFFAPRIGGRASNGSGGQPAVEGLAAVQPE